MRVALGRGRGKGPPPRASAAAVSAAGLRLPRSGVVAFGLVELGAGGAGALSGGRVAFAACYLLLGAFAVRLLLRAPTAPCACLGSTNTVVTRTHVVIDVAAACVAIGGRTDGRGYWIATDT